MLREPLSSRARRQIRMLRGQHHEADSCCFGIRVGSGRRLARSRFTRLHYESDVSTGLAATGTEARFVCFVVSTTKQIRAASVSGWAQGGGWREADSLAFTTNLTSVPVWLRPVLKPDSYASWSAPRSRFVLLRSWCWSFSEAPSWSFGEASPNDSEGTSVAFTTVAAENLCASDHESPSCCRVWARVLKGLKGLKRPSLQLRSRSKSAIVVLYTYLGT